MMSDPQDGTSDSLGDLFDNLPTAAPSLPERQAPQAPAPGSRRALREAAAREAAARQGEQQAATSDDIAASGPSARAQAGASAAADSDAVASDSAGSGAADSEPVASETAASDPAQTRDDALSSLFAPNAAVDVPRKRRGRGCLIGLVIVLAVLGGIAAGGAWVYSTYQDKIDTFMGWGEPKDWEPGQATGEAYVTIKKGDTGSPVSTALFEAKVTKTDRVFYQYLVDNNVTFTLYPGVYKLQQKMTAEAALKALDDPENRMANTVRIAEGSTVATSLARIAEGVEEISVDDLKAVVEDPSVYGVEADRLEGWLFPAVYTFDPGVTPQEIIQAMVDRTHQALQNVGVPEADAERVLTIASIIEREGHTADFDKVSRVIENRLDKSNQETHGLLQMDSTAQYGYGLTHEGPVSSWRWKEVVGDDNPWNTYATAGLPATPISNPSEAAIKAAAHPADGPWFYFVTVNLDTGETIFSATYKEQQAAEAEYRAWCKANPDSGCY